MPDVTRSDSQRSDTSLRPRVSFNRDVHIKRIVPRKEVPPFEALNGDGEGHLVITPVRKERLKKSKKELKEEAARVIHQADKIDCVSSDGGITPEKFYSLPRKKNNWYPSIERKARRSSNADINEEIPPKKPPRTFQIQQQQQQQKKPSIFDFFTNRKSNGSPKSSPKKSNLRRSVSDASYLRSSNYKRESLDNLKKHQEGFNNKKQLSPIIEVTQREDYFSPNIDEENNQNLTNRQEKSVTERLKEYIDEVDDEIFKETGIKVDNNSEPENTVKETEVIIIDVDQAKKISNNKKSSIRKKFKALTSKKPKTNDEKKLDNTEPKEPQSENTEEMIHSNKKIHEKLPLTRSKKVDSMVKILNNDHSQPPPKTNILITPSIATQHNNNQPFSYTRGLSPEKCTSNENLAKKPVIYAQVVCNNGSSKQTIHTEFNGNGKKTQSDSDEGLGYEDQDYKRKILFGTEEDPITPKIRNVVTSKPDFFDTKFRGRGDGMDSIRKREDEIRNDISARRDLLESRINRRINNSKSSSPNYRHESDLDNEPKSFDSHITDYRSSPETKFENNNYKYRVIKKDKSIYKSTPEIYHAARYEKCDEYHDSYHDSLRREKHESRNITRKYYDTNSKERFIDSGIENDYRRNSIENFKYQQKNYIFESEDEGFASSLLIPNEKSIEKKIEDAKRQFKKDNYVPRERSIDDGAYFDPRLDKQEINTNTLKKIEKKPPKPEKKSGLQKVKQLFTRDNKKKKGKQGGMVREEILRARYTEYKGSTESLDPKKRADRDHEENLNYLNRRRLSTPSSSPTREIQSKEKPNEHNNNWFKSLDRLSKKKNKKVEKEENFTSTEEEIIAKPKNLRFFGDTDADSSDNNSSKQKLGIRHKDRIKSHSTRELHNISEETPSATLGRNNHKSMTNIWNSSKPPISPNRKPREPTSRRRKEFREESSTEGEGSQQSQRSVVYLHAATVGDIPGPAYLRNGKVSSREDLNNGKIQTQKKTLSRSFSVLAPWKPKHYERDIDYTQYPKQNKYEQKPHKHQSSSRKDNSSTLKRKAHDTKRLHQSTSTLNRRSRSKESISDVKSNEGHNSTSTLFKKKEKNPRENSRYSSNSREGKVPIRSNSMESFSARNRYNKRESSNYNTKK